MTLEVGATVTGKVIKIIAEGVLVSLPDGKTGLIPVTQGTGRSYFSAGEVIITRITTPEAEGRFELALVSAEMSSKPADRFEQEVSRLNHVLKLHSPQAEVRPRTREPLWEEQLEKWITSVDRGLSHLRKHRGKRLNETFYKEGKD